MSGENDGRSGVSHGRDEQRSNRSEIETRGGGRNSQNATDRSDATKTEAAGEPLKCRQINELMPLGGTPQCPSSHFSGEHRSGMAARYWQ
jgi:hypothetical protein